MHDFGLTSIFFWSVGRCNNDQGREVQISLLAYLATTLLNPDLPSLPHLAGDSRILEPSPAYLPGCCITKISRISVLLTNKIVINQSVISNYLKLHLFLISNYAQKDSALWTHQQVDCAICLGLCQHCVSIQ